MNPIDMKVLAKEMEAALEEAKQAYNKAGGRKQVKISRRSLYLLTVAACHTFGIPVIVDGAETASPPTHNPKMN